MSRDYRFRYNDILSNQNPPPLADTCSTPTSHGAFTPINPMYQYWPTPQTTPPYIPIKQQLPSVQFVYPSFTAQSWTSGGGNSRQQIQGCVVRQPEENRVNGYDSVVSKPEKQTAHNSGITSPQMSSYASVNYMEHFGSVASRMNVGQLQPEPARSYKKDYTQQTKLLVKCLQKCLTKRCKSPFKILRQASDSQSQLLLLFTNHCATLIQKHFRRFMQQKYYRHYKAAVARMKQLINAAVQGWRVRRVMKCKAIQRMVEDIKRKEQEKKLAQMRIQKRDLTKEIAKLIKSGRWVDEYRASRKNQRVSKVGAFRFVTVPNKAVTTIGGSSSVEQSEKSMRNQQNSLKKSTEEMVPNRFDDMPLPTQQSKPSSMDQIPIKANPNANSYNFEQVHIDDPIEKSRPQMKRPPAAKKKKVIKLSNNAVLTNNPETQAPPKRTSVEKAKQQIVEPPPKYGFNQRIKGDTDPLDTMSVLQHTDAPQKQDRSMQRIDKDQNSEDQKDEKKKFLKKRMRYDPRKAIQEQKKRKQNGVSSRVAQPIQDRSLQKYRPSQLTDLTMRPITTNPNPIRSKSPDVAKQFNTTLKKFSKIQSSKVQSSIPVGQVSLNTKVITIKSPTYTKQRHINLNELQQTYTGSYIKKKVELNNLIERLGRSSKKMSYPLPAIRQMSEIYRTFQLDIYQDAEDLLEREFLSMLNM